VQKPLAGVDIPHSSPSRRGIPLCALHKEPSAPSGGCGVRVPLGLAPRSALFLEVDGILLWLAADIPV
jgi:hypothetical protein